MVYKGLEFMISGYPKSEGLLQKGSGIRVRSASLVPPYPTYFSYTMLTPNPSLTVKARNAGIPIGPKVVPFWDSLIEF